MELRTASYLFDARAKYQELVSFCDGKTKDEFLGDRGLNLAVCVLIEMLGESLKQIERREPSLFAQIPEARFIIETRHSAIHDYANVDYSVLWEIARNQTPRIDQTIAAMLDNAEIHDKM
jgi:uncharacterized protein with HEPN domain